MDDEGRDAAVRRRRENLAESVMGNATLGGAIGAFVGYTGGAILGTTVWSMKSAMRFSHAGVVGGFLIGAVGNGGASYLKLRGQHRAAREAMSAMLAERQRPVPVDELLYELDLLRERERVSGESMEAAKTRLKEQIRSATSRGGPQG